MKPNMIKNQKKLYNITKYLIIFTSIFLFTISTPKNIKFNYALIILLFSIFVPLLLLIKRRNFDMFEPIYLFGYFFSLLYLFTSIYIYNYSSTTLFTSLRFDPLDDVNFYLILYLSFSIIMLYLGYYISSRIHKNRKTGRLNSTKLTSFNKYMFPLYILSISFRIYGYVEGFMGSTVGQTNVTLPSIPFISILIFISNIWFIYFGFYSLLSFSSKKYMRLFLLFLIIEIFFVVISGNRRDILKILIIYLASMWYTKGVFPWKKLAKWGAVVLIVFLPITTIYGYLLSYNIGKNLNLNDILVILKNSSNILFKGGNDFSFFDLIFFPIIQSYNGLYNVSIAFTEFYQKNLMFGAIGLTNFTKMILPTFLAPDKHYYAREFINLYGHYAMTYTSNYSPLTILFPTEMLMSFGIISLFIGMFLLGFFMNSIYKIFNSHNSPLIYRTFYISSIPYFSYGLNSSWLLGDIITPLRLIFYLILFRFFYIQLKKISLQTT